MAQGLARLGARFGCLLAGFLLGLLIFGAPWHRPANWGDIPTWLLVLVGVIGGWAALRQLRMLQQQVTDEARRNIKRDELLDRQLSEAEARALSERRRQAEEVELDWYTLDGYVARVQNKSPRPVTDITRKVMSKVDRAALALPNSCGEIIHLNPEASPGTFMPEAKPVSRFETLRPGAACGFDFRDLRREPDHIVVAWFTDDAVFRWQLDEYLHLVAANDGDAYVL